MNIPRVAILKAAILIFAVVTAVSCVLIFNRPESSDRPELHDLSKENSNADGEFRPKEGEWLNKAQFDKFHSLTGCTTDELIRWFGQPTKKTQRENGVERWHYPFDATAWVDLDKEKGTVLGVYHTAGY